MPLSIYSIRILYSQIQRNELNVNKGIQVRNKYIEQGISILNREQIGILIGIYTLSIQGQSSTRLDQEIYIRIGDTVFRVFLVLLYRFFAFFKQLLVLVQFSRGYVILLHDLVSYIQDIGYRTCRKRDILDTSTNQAQRIQGSYIRTSIL